MSTKLLPRYSDPGSVHALNVNRDRSMATAALSREPETADHKLEGRVSLRMGEDERRRVAMAVGVRESSAVPDPRLTEAVNRVRELRAELAGERQRCAGICAGFPDNLMAQYIRKLILEGN